MTRPSEPFIEMNGAQKKAVEELRAELGSRRKTTEGLPIKGEGDGFVFTEVDGVTVTVGEDGGYHVPAVRTYRQSSLGAALTARELFDRQWERDRKNLLKAIGRVTGHLGPIVNVDWCCDDQECFCRSEDIVVRRGRSV